MSSAKLNPAVQPRVTGQARGTSARSTDLEGDAFWKVGGKRKEWVIDAKHGIAVRPFIQGPGIEVVGKTEKVALSRGYAFDVRVKVEADLLKLGVKIEKDLTFKFRGEDFRIHLSVLPEGKIGADGELRYRVVVRPIRPTAELDVQGMAGAQAKLGTEVTVFANGEQLSHGTADVFCNVGPVFGQDTKIGLTHFHQRRLIPMGAYTVGYELELSVNPLKVLKLLPELADPKVVKTVGELERDGKLDAVG